MREDGEKEAMELDVLLERYDALVREAKNLEARVKLCRLAGAETERAQWAMQRGDSPMRQEVLQPSLRGQKNDHVELRGDAVPGPGGGYLAPYALEARMLLLRMGITQEEAAIRIGMARGTLARKLTGFSKVYPEEIASLRELARKMRKV